MFHWADSFGYRRLLRLKTSLAANFQLSFLINSAKITRKKNFISIWLNSNKLKLMVIIYRKTTNYVIRC